MENWDAPAENGRRLWIQSTYQSMDQKTAVQVNIYSNIPEHDNLSVLSAYASRQTQIPPVQWLFSIRQSSFVVHRSPINAVIVAEVGSPMTWYRSGILRQNIVHWTPFTPLENTRKFSSPQHIISRSSPKSLLELTSQLARIHFVVLNFAVTWHQRRPAGHFRSEIRNTLRLGRRQHVSGRLGDRRHHVFRLSELTDRSPRSKTRSIRTTDVIICRKNISLLSSPVRIHCFDEHRLYVPVHELRACTAMSFW